jgi:hypothetical protein
VKKFRPQTLILLAIGLGSVLHGAIPLPFAVEDPQGVWKTSTVERAAAPGITLETLIVHSSGKSRFAVFRCASAGNSPEALKAFGAHLKAVLLTGPSSNRAESDTEEFGYQGNDQQFDLPGPGEAITCDLFVFAREKTWWGVLYMALKSGAAPTAAPFAILRKKDPAADDVVEMAPFVAADTPVTSFPIGLSVTTDPLTGRVAKILVNEVPPGSTTERAGIKVGDEIISINHRKTRDFAVGLGKSSELGLIFLNRDPGDDVMLELLSPHEAKPWTVVLQIPVLTYPAYRLRP